MGKRNSIISVLANIPGQVWGEKKKNGNGNDDIGSFADRVQIERLLYTYGYAVDATDHDKGKALYLSILVKMQNTQSLDLVLLLALVITLQDHQVREE